VTTVPCPRATGHGTFATTWGLYAHLLNAHGLDPATAATLAADVLESVILDDGGRLTGRLTQVRP